jgi:hypothetical protein
MTKHFVDLEHLIPGERYSFTDKDFPGARSQGIFDRVIDIPNKSKQYFFLNVLEPSGPAGSINYSDPNNYPGNIIHLPLDGATPPQPPQLDDGDISPQPTARGKSRKSKRTKQTKRTRKSKRRHRKSRRR